MKLFRTGSHTKCTFQKLIERNNTTASKHCNKNEKKEQTQCPSI